MTWRSWLKVIFLLGFSLALIILADELVAGLKDLVRLELWQILTGLGLGGGLVLANYFLAAELWRRLVIRPEDQLGFGAVAAAFLAGNLLRYLPGKVWSWGGQAGLLTRARIPFSRGLGASLLATLYLLGGSALVGCLALGLFDPALSGWLWLGGGVLLGLLALPFFLRLLPRLIKKISLAERWVAILTLEPAGRVGLGLAILASLVYGLAGGLVAGVLNFSAEAAFLAGCAVLLGDCLGLVAFFAPGGLGVREATIIGVFGLSGLSLDPEEIILFALGFRLVTIFADLVSALWAGWYLKKH